MKLAPYPKYKPSGVEWLGEVPEHWEVDRLKWTTSGTVNGTWGEEPNGVDDLICVRVADFDRERFLVIGEPPTLRDVDNAQRKGRLLRKGDLLIEKSGGGEKQLVGCVVFFDHEFAAVCSNFVARMPIVPRHSARFWAYAHAALYDGRLNYPAIKQTTGIQNLDSAAYLDTRVGLPPEDEQRAIADFLDRETAKINMLVAKKGTLIERLQEKRTALISRTVTRSLPPNDARAAGLDPHPKLKPTGIAWLGEVPQHWAVKAIKWESTVLRGASPRPIDNEIYFDEKGAYAWVRIADVSAAGMYLRETTQQLSDLGRSLSVPLEPGALFLSIAGSVGKPCITGIKCCIHDGFVYFPFWRGESRFLYYLFASGEPYKGLGKLGTQLNLNTDTVGSIVAGFPALAEQQAIADFLDHEIGKLNVMATKIETAIERLQEYRAALITAAVTGKIDVREAAA